MMTYGLIESWDNAQSRSQKTFYQFVNLGEVEDERCQLVEPQGHGNVKGQGVGIFFLDYAPHSLDEWEFQNGLYRWSL